MPTDYTGPDKNKKKDDVVIEKKVEKVVTTEVIQKKKSLGRKFKDVFFGGDFKSAARYVTGEVLLPALRNMVVDTTTKAIERAIYGESMGSRRSNTRDYRGYVQYNSPVLSRPYTHLPDQPRRYVDIPRRVERRDESQLIIPSRSEAERVVEQLIDIVEKYDQASVADLYELVGLPTAHTDNKWGWTSFARAEIRQVRDGYLLDLPPAEPI